MKLERVPIAVIYKQNGYLNIEFSDNEAKGYEIYGFLTIYLKELEKVLSDSLESD